MLCSLASSEACDVSISGTAVGRVLVDSAVYHDVMVHFRSVPLHLWGLVTSQFLVGLFGRALSVTCMMVDVGLKAGINRCLDHSNCLFCSITLGHPICSSKKLNSLQLFDKIRQVQKPVNRRSMSSKMVVSAASGPVKPLNGFFLVFFFHVALGCKNGANASSVDRVCIKLVFHASSVVLDSYSDKVHCICAVAAIFQIQHQNFLESFSPLSLRLFQISSVLLILKVGLVEEWAQNRCHHASERWEQGDDLPAFNEEHIYRRKSIT